MHDDGVRARGASGPGPGPQFVDVTADGVKGNGSSASPVVSADGRHVAFLSWATNLAPRDTDSTADVYVKDLRTGKLRWVSDVPGGQGEEVAFGTPSISADGTRVAFAALPPSAWPPPHVAHPSTDARGRVVAFDGDRLDLQGEDGSGERQAVVLHVR